MYSVNGETALSPALKPPPAGREWICIYMLPQIESVGNTNDQSFYPTGTNVYCYSHKQSPFSKSFRSYSKFIQNTHSVINYSPSSHSKPLRTHLAESSETFISFSWRVTRTMQRGVHQPICCSYNINILLLLLLYKYALCNYILYVFLDFWKGPEYFYYFTENIYICISTMNKSLGFGMTRGCVNDRIYFFSELFL